MWGRVVRPVVVLLAAGLLMVALLGMPGGDGPLRSTPVAVASGDELGSVGEYHSLTPARILDTRRWDARPVTGRDGREFDVAVLGLGGLPAPLDADGDGVDDRVLAVAVNVTVVAPSEAGFLSARGAGTSDGGASLLNFPAGVDMPNSAVLRPGVDGRLTLSLVTPAGSGTADVLIDVFGWFSTAEHPVRGARLVPVRPERLADTRKADGPLGVRGVLTVPIRGAGPVPSSPTVVAALVNLTGVNDLPGARDTYLSVVPERPVGVPATSNLNLGPGVVKPVTAIVPVGADGAIRVVNWDGSVHVLVDVFGYLVTGADAASRAGRVIPLEAPYRILDTRQDRWGDIPMPPDHTEVWSFAGFVESVSAVGGALGPQSAVIGNLTATGLRSSSTARVASGFVSVAPDDGRSFPDVSNINLVPGRDVANMALLPYGGDGADRHRVRMFNAFGNVDVIFDATAVVLDERPEPPPTTSTTTSSTTTTSVPATTTSPPASTSSTSTSSTTSSTSSTSTTSSTTIAPTTT